MAAKRARTSGGSVTGGTGDIKPQYLTLNTGVTAVDDYTVNQVALPVPRFGTMKTMATIMELLSVDWYINIVDAGDIAKADWAYFTTSTTRQDGETSTLATAATDVEDPQTFGFVLVSKEQATAVGINTQIFPTHIDFTDQNGNGILVATDRLFVVGGNVAGTAAGNYTAKLKYRQVNVGITEYVGIVQSQQI